MGGIVSGLWEAAENKTARGIASLFLCNFPYDSVLLPGATGPAEFCHTEMNSGVLLTAQSRRAAAAAALLRTAGAWSSR